MTGTTSDPGEVFGEAPASALIRARTFLTRIGLQSDDNAGRWTSLVGGVSSNLWRVDLPDRTVCVKGALARLRVADDWRAPVSRNAVEYAWLEFAGRLRPANVPRLYGRDDELGFFVMEFLAPDSHPNWKTQLMSGAVSRDFAAAVGDLVGALQAVSATDARVPTTFATDANFAALRLDPYLRTAATRNPAVGDVLEALAERTANTHLALVHGDVSPKNILVGAAGPVLLDAECAWFGDPAFDVAFCLTHLACKMLVHPDRRGELLECGEALIAAHARHISWEATGQHGARVATLLPALLLARVDGASPVEYLDPEQRALVRGTATGLLQAPGDDPAQVLTAWHDAVR